MRRRLHIILIGITRLSPRRKAGFICILLLLLAYAFCLPRQLFRVPYSTVVTDCHGELLGARIAPDGQWRFPPCDTVPRKFVRCLLAFEDRHFYYHPGVNPLSMARAAWQNIRQGRIVSGGSTLTMQTVRISRNRPRTFAEKVVEMILATRLELRCSKDEILALYASHAPFGGNVVGLDAAAWRYFAHPASELSWAEAATLAVLPNAPSAIHPGKGREALLRKRNRVLRLLLEQGELTPSEYELATDEPLPDAPLPLPRIAPHLVDRLASGQPGQTLVSTVDKSLQLRLEALAERHSREFARSDIRNLAILVIDLQDNRVAAYCGNTGWGNPANGSQVDIIRAPRSTGSILKPILYYAALEEGLILPRTLLPDIPVNINGFTPQNFSRQFEGAVPASEALARSLNIPPVQLLQEYGVPKFHGLLRQAGLTTLDRPASHYGLSLILGGAEATLWDVTSAYARMGRSLLGLPQTTPRLLAPEESGGPEEPGHLFRPGGVWQVFDALTEVNRPEEIDWKSIPSMHPVAWKTGTSYGFRDAWAVGVTPRYAVGVWVGNASGEGKPGLVGARTAGPVLFDVLSLLPAAPRWFERPDGVFVDAEVCRLSGHLKGRFCNETDTVLILPAGRRTAPCPYHRPVILSADGTYRLHQECAGSEPTLSASWFVLPPVWEWYYKQHHPEYRPLPPFKPGCGGDASRTMQFIYPTPGARITLPRQMDGTPGHLVARVAYGQAGATLFWHLDDAYLGETRDFHEIALQPAPGRHSLTVVDGEGNTVSVTFHIKK